MVEVVLGRNSSKKGGRFLLPAFLSQRKAGVIKSGAIKSKGLGNCVGLMHNRRAEGLPMYAIGIIIIGIIILAVVLIFIFGVSGQGTNLSQGLFNIQGNVTSNASATAKGFAGG